VVAVCRVSNSTAGLARDWAAAPQSTTVDSLRGQPAGRVGYRRAQHVGEALAEMSAADPVYRTQLAMAFQSCCTTGCHWSSHVAPPICR